MCIDDCGFKSHFNHGKAYFFVNAFLGKFRTSFLRLHQKQLLLTVRARIPQKLDVMTSWSWNIDVVVFQSWNLNAVALSYLKKMTQGLDVVALWSLILDVVTLRLPKNVFVSRCFGFIVSVSRCGGYMRGRGSLVL